MLSAVDQTAFMIFYRLVLGKGLWGFDYYDYESMTVKVLSAFSLLMSFRVCYCFVCKFFFGSSPLWVGLINFVDTKNLI
jgi:hypothetical protein